MKYSRIFTYLSISLISISISGCGEHPLVKIYDKNITKTTLPCLALSVFPPDKEASKTIKKLYRFKKSCPYTLHISTKEGIICHSSGNAPQKAMSNFPSAYLRLELNKGTKLIYTYYVDLTHEADSSDIEDAFERFSDDIPISTKD